MATIWNLDQHARWALRTQKASGIAGGLVVAVDEVCLGVVCELADDPRLAEALAEPDALARVKALANDPTVGEILDRLGL